MYPALKTSAMALVMSLLMLNAPSTVAEHHAAKAVSTHIDLLLKTNKGDIILSLNTEKAPISVANFLTYVDGKHYDNTLFHRVIPGFMIQGGGYTTDMTQKATLPPITNEAQNGLKNQRGTLAMARRNSKDSATSQFFINLANNGFLNHGSRGFGYAVFGKVTQGMDVVDAIAAVNTLPGDRPVEPVVITSIQRMDTGATQTDQASQEIQTAPPQVKAPN